MVLAKLKSLMGNQAIHIAEANMEDVGAVADIHTNSFSRGWSDGDIRRMISNPDYICLVAKQKGSPDKPCYGFLLMRTALDEAEIISIAIEKSARRRGVAQKLIEAGIWELRKSGIKKLFLEVDELNKAAVALYQRLSFKQIAERKGYYPSSDNSQTNASSALVMQRDLG